MIFNSGERLQRLLDRADELMTRIERVLPSSLPNTPEGDGLAWRWRRKGRDTGGFIPVARPA